MDSRPTDSERRPERPASTDRPIKPGDDPQPIRAQLRFTGRVQGVGFRATTERIARGFRVTGWVRNEPDGTVLLEAQGEPSEVEALTRAIREGMQENIRGVERAHGELIVGEQGFKITG